MLNKIPCLDKGFVAYVDSILPTRIARELEAELFVRQEFSTLRNLASLTLAIKSPIFVEKVIRQMRFDAVSVPQSGELEAYLPNPGEIGAPELETSRAIADDIARTTAALLINPKAYQQDGCDRFISQLITPINVYTTIIVTGSYSEWSKFVEMPGLPESVKHYQRAVKQVLDAEWTDNGTQEDATAQETKREA